MRPSRTVAVTICAVAGVALGGGLQHADGATPAPGPQAQAPPAAHAAAPAPAKPVVRYGSNPAAGRTFTHDSVKLYYEVYGAGDPLLLVHGNGSSIGSFKAQIDHFRERNKVIAMDSRDQGQSGDSPDEITYEKMTDDLAALVDHLGVGPVDVLGWSDGGIEALLLGLRHPAKVKKIAAMAANLNPSDRALVPEMLALIKSMVDSMPPAVRETPQGRRELKVTGMILATRTSMRRRSRRSPRLHWCWRPITT